MPLQAGYTLHGEANRANQRGLVRDRGSDAGRFVSHLSRRSVGQAALSAAERAEASGLAVPAGGMMTDDTGALWWQWDVSEWDGEAVMP